MLWMVTVMAEVSCCRVMIVGYTRVRRCERVVLVPAGIGLDGFRIDGGQLPGCLCQNVPFLVGTDPFFIPLPFQLSLSFAFQLPLPLLRLFQIDVDQDLGSVQVLPLLLGLKKTYK